MTLDRRTRRDRRNLVPAQSPPPVSEAFTQACDALLDVWPKDTAPRQQDPDSDQSPTNDDDDPFSIFDDAKVFDALCRCGEAMQAAQAVEHHADTQANSDRLASVSEFFESRARPDSNLGRGKCGTSVADLVTQMLKGANFRDLKKHPETSPNGIVIARDAVIGCCMAERVRPSDSVLQSLGPVRGFLMQHTPDERLAMLQKFGIRLHAQARWNDSHRLLARKLPPYDFTSK